MPDVQRDPALARVLVVELTAHVGIGHAGQRTGRRVTRRAAADGRHRGHARVRVALELDLDALGAEGGEEPRTAGRGEKPREVEDADPLQRERLGARRERLALRWAPGGGERREVAL